MSTQLAPSRPGMTEPLRLREFRLLLIGFILGQSMMPLQFVASIAWIQHVASEEVEIIMVGAIGTIRGLGMIGFGLFGGALADRFDRRRLLMVTQTLAFACNIGIAIVVFAIPGFTRLARAQMLGERNKDYVLAAQVLGASTPRIIFRHIVINALPPLLVQVALAIASGVLIVAALGYFGLGIEADTPSLGGLVNDSRPYLQRAWWYPVFPGAILAFLLLCLNLLADAINAAISPYTRS